MTKARELSRIAKHKRVRARVMGTSERPRLSVHRSLKNLQLQLVDDTQSKIIMSMTTSGKNIKDKVPLGGNVKAASLFGELFAKEAIAKGVKQIVFDRGGYPYHGRIKSLAESLRKGGLVF